LIVESDTTQIAWMPSKAEKIDSKMLKANWLCAQHYDHFAQAIALLNDEQDEESSRIELAKLLASYEPGVQKEKQLEMEKEKEREREREREKEASVATSSSSSSLSIGGGTITLLSQSKRPVQRKRTRNEISAMALGLQARQAKVARLRKQARR
jgi:Atrophin-1 family